MTSIGSIISRVSSLTETQTINLTHPESPFPSSDSFISLPLNSSNPISALQSNSNSSSSLPTSLLSPCSINLITSLLPSLPDLLSKPIVLHLSTNGDHSDLLTLRSTGIPIFYSSTKVQAQAHSLLAIKLAKITQSLVIHYFDVEEDSKGASFEQVTDKDVVDWLNSDEKDLQYENLPNGSSLSNGANGHTNGHSNGHSNGIDSSSSSSSSSTSHSPARKSTSSLETILTSLYSSVSSLVGEQISPYTLHGNDSSSNLAIVLGSHSSELSSDDLAVLEVSLVRPSLPNLLIKSLPKDVKRIATLEKTLKRTTRLGPLFVDVALAFQTNEEGIKRPDVLIGGILADVSSESSSSSQSIVKSLERSRNHFIIGNLEKKSSSSKESTIVEQIKVPKHEEAYNVMLEQVFGERLSVINSAKGNDETSTHPSAKSPEYAFGQVLSQLEARDDLLLAVEEALRQGEIDDELHSILSQYALSKDDSTRNKSIEAKFLTQISRKDIKPTEALKKIQSLSKHVESKSRWIIGSDSWAYDTGMSGVHHVISSGKNVNMLIFDSVPYTKRDSIVPEKRKKDIALYAMNYGNVYVASTAVYADYTQVLHALMEADKFKGPSIVLAYIPYRTENAPALDVLKETKLAVDSGYWPLFRWDPSNEDKAEKEVFRLDGVRMRESLKNFLERNNNLTLLANSKPQLSYDLAVSSGVGLREAQKSKAKKAYEALLGNMDGPPLLILYASDGGNAEKVAKKLSMRAKARGLASRCLTMDDFPISEELKEEKNVAFISSTAGQGEFPQNGRETFKTLSKLDQGSLPDTVNFTVFGMGDSHYWPRAEDAHYYNKPAKDLDIKLESLGASRSSPLGLGDDQDSDGWQTGYKPWEANLWKSLGVDTVNVTEAEPEAINNEHMKIASNFLRGTIVEGLADTSTGAIAETDTQLTKFHGTYMQYDRDTLEERKNAGLEPAYSFMIRARIPGGVCTPDQWLQLDKVAGDYGNGTIKITTRQTIQYHCVVKSNLKKAMQGINKSMLDTIAACGDVNRNVMCSPNPALSQLHEDVYDFSKKISEHLLPRMDAYHEIWLDEETESKKKQLLVGGALQDYEPLYGAYYLPRKFKIAIAVPPRNDVDCFAHDIGLIAIADKKGKLQGFNLAVGGGMGVTHSMKITYPRLGDVLGFITPEQTLKVCETVMLIQRDTGNRANRKQARLKYTVDKVWGGALNFKAELERRLGYKLEAEKPYKFEMNTDEYGWKKDYKGNWHCTLWLENGRVRDIPGDEFRTGLRELCKIHKGNLRLTPNQHIIISDITPDKKEEIDGHLRKWKMDNWNHSGLKLSASACVAFPTCGLAMAESERYLPELVDKVETIFEKNGLRNDEVTMRMTGCPNGCARPWVAEIAFVGKAPGTYLMLLGGGHAGERLNKIYRDNVTESDILEILTPMIARYAKERTDNEPFGDWVIRAGIIAPTTSGAEFYDNVNTEGDAPALEQKAKAAA